MTTSATAADRPRSASAGTLGRIARDNVWTLSLFGLLAALLAFTKLINSHYGLTSLQFTATAVVPLALAAVAQAVIVISGGIDLSVSSQMALTSCVAATLMANYPGDGTAVVIILLALALGLLLGAINGALVVLTKVPDIIITLSTYFVWAGFALLVAQPSWLSR